MIAVITGDLIGSTGVEDPTAFRARLKSLLTQLQKKFGIRSYIYRGDGFQITAGAKTNAFELAILLRTGLIAHSPLKRERWDARLAIALGKGKLSSGSENSPAHIESGRALDEMTQDNLTIAAIDDVGRLASAVATAFVDDTLNQLSPAEAEVFYYYFLDQGSHQDIADRVAKSRPTVTKALQRGKYLLLHRYVRDMDALVRLKAHE